MARNGTTYQDVVFVGEYLHYFQAFNLNAVLAHSACHAHSLENAAGVRRTTDRTRGSLAVVLAVGSFTHTAESVALYNTLETFTLGGANHFNLIAFSENVYSDGITNIFFFVVVSEFFDTLFGRSIGLCEVILGSFDRVLFFLVAESELEGIIAVCVLSFNLCDHTRTGFDNRAGSLLAACIEDAGHPNFFTNDSFHFLTVFPRKVVQDRPMELGTSILVQHRPFLLRAEASAKACPLAQLKLGILLDVHLR